MIVTSPRKTPAFIDVVRESIFPIYKKVARSLSIPKWSGNFSNKHAGDTASNKNTVHINSIEVSDYSRIAFDDRNFLEISRRKLIHSNTSSVKHGWGDCGVIGANSFEHTAYGTTFVKKPYAPAVAVMPFGYTRISSSKLDTNKGVRFVSVQAAFGDSGDQGSQHLPYGYYSLTDKDFNVVYRFTDGVHEAFGEDVLVFDSLPWEIGRALYPCPMGSSFGGPDVFTSTKYKTAVRSVKFGEITVEIDAKDSAAFESDSANRLHHIQITRSGTNSDIVVNEPYARKMVYGNVASYTIKFTDNSQYKTRKSKYGMVFYRMKRVDLPPIKIAIADDANTGIVAVSGALPSLFRSAYIITGDEFIEMSGGVFAPIPDSGNITIESKFVPGKASFYKPEFVAELLGDGQFNVSGNPTHSIIESGAKLDDGFARTAVFNSSDMTMTIYGGPQLKLSWKDYVPVMLNGAGEIVEVINLKKSIIENGYYKFPNSSTVTQGVKHLLETYPVGNFAGCTCSIVLRNSFYKKVDHAGVREFSDKLTDYSYSSTPVSSFTVTTEGYWNSLRIHKIGVLTV